MTRAWPLLLTLLLAAAPALAVDAEPPLRSAAEVLRDLKSDDPDVRLAATAEAKLHQDPKITSQLLKLLRDRESDVRETAVESLGARTERAGKRLAAQALASRLSGLSGRVEHEVEYRLTIRALHDLAQPVAVHALLDLEPEEPKETAQQRMLAVGNTPHATAIEGLIAFASKSRRGHRDLAVQGLRYATGQNLGSGPDRWRDWWHDVERDWDFQLAADRRQAARDAAEEKRRKQEEKRRQAEEKRRKREEERRRREEERGGVGD